MMLVDYLLQHNRYCNILGIMFILFIAYLFSQKKSHINFKLVFNGLLMQFFLGFIVLKTDLGSRIISVVADGVTMLYQFADQGSRFVFGDLVNPSGPWGFIFAFRVLPVIIFFGALMAVFFHFGIIQKVVMAVSFIIRPLLGTSGAETLCAIANSFLGQTEAPLLIRHYLKHMSKSEILVVMVSGMGTISGAILVVFAAMGVPAVHLLTASMMAIPGTMVIAKILLPETEKSATNAGAQAEVQSDTANVLDAIASGTSDGLNLVLNVAAMLIAFLGLIAMINAILGALFATSLNTLFAYLFLPFGYLLGFSGSDAYAAGQLIGTKVAINELIAYGQMVKMGLSDRAVSIITYALCGFSNFSCIGIQIGGIGALVPEKRKLLTEFGLYAVLGGTLANLLSAMIAGLLL